MNVAGPRCFPFYSGEPKCLQCKMMDRCKALANTDGVDIAAAMIDQLTTELEESGVTVVPVVLAPRAMVKVLIDPKAWSEQTKSKSGWIPGV